MFLLPEKPGQEKKWWQKAIHYNSAKKKQTFYRCEYGSNSQRIGRKVNFSVTKREPFTGATDRALGKFEQRKWRNYFSG